MKTLFHIVLVLLLAIGWLKYSESYNRTTEEGMKEALIKVEEGGASEEEIIDAQAELESDKNTALMNGILLTIVTAVYGGTMFVIYVLPMFVHRATQVVYDSTEKVDQDAMHDARSKVAQGDYDGAIAAFYEAAQAEPMNRIPYVEISKIQRVNQENPQAAVATLTQVIEGQSWEENDAAFLMFRLAEIYHEDLHDIAAASSVMQQVVDQFPATRHSANASHKLQDWAKDSV